MSKAFNPDALPVFELGTHCEAPLQRMPKLDRARWCENCQRKVHDFAEMTPEEILALFAGDPERICARVETDGGGRIRTRATTAGLILTAVLTLPTASLSAQSPKPVVQNAGAQHIKGTGVYGVVSDDGTPLSGVKVTATRSSDNHEASTVTRSDGAYSFTNLVPGAYELSFYAPTGLKPMPGRRSDESWEIHDVQVCAGTMLIKDTSGPISFAGSIAYPRPGTPEHSVAAAAGKQGIKGRLLTQSGEAISGGKVVAVEAANHAPHSTTTDQYGSFSFTGLEPGTYSLIFSAPGFENQTVPALQVVAGYARLQDAQLCPTTRR